jgi:hypothetical protein
MTSLGHLVFKNAHAPEVGVSIADHAGRIVMNPRPDISAGAGLGGAACLRIRIPVGVCDLETGTYELVVALPESVDDGAVKRLGFRIQ